MKIFIIHASAGSGHQKIAESIYESAVEKFGRSNVSLLDILDFTPPFFKFLYSKGYIFLISKLAWLWAFFFFLSDTKYMKLFNVNLRCFNNRVLCRQFIEFIKSENPDYVISTHFLVNELVSFLKENNLVKTKLISVVTDFGVHNFWIANSVDTYIAASVKTKEILISKGIREEKIKVLGIPVRKQFQKTMDKIKIKGKFKIDNGLFTVLILTGGIGIGPIYDIAKNFNDEVNIIAICGKNKKLFEELNNLNFSNLRIFGWIDNIEEAMFISDLIITKPGGSTISECLLMNLPMVFFSIIPGQEAQNARIISDYGFGIRVKTLKEIREKALYFKNNYRELRLIQDRIRIFSQKDSVESLLREIDEQ